MFTKFALFGVLILLPFTLIESEDVADLIHPVETEEYDPKVFEEILTSDLTEDLQDEEPKDNYEHYNKCDVDIRKPRGISGVFHWSFVKKFVSHFNVFKKSQNMHMRFFLFRREFPDCGHEIDTDDDRAMLLSKGFNPKDPTRIIVHGWMSQARGTLNRDIKAAYLERGNFNIIVADWSESSSNLNYFTVVTLIEALGGRLADLTKHMNTEMDASFDDMYIIGHSLGAQIAGAAGKLIQPNKFNTIFALDPAGPKFRKLPPQFRIDPTDAKYVESIQTSGNLGFKNPTGNATFYPNWGNSQKNCHIIGCSHVRAYKMFAESITSKLGFWGSKCSQRDPKWVCENERFHVMGGEPSSPKSGLFYVDTNGEAPFAMGR